MSHCKHESRAKGSPQPGGVITWASCRSSHFVASNPVIVKDPMTQPLILYLLEETKFMSKYYYLSVQYQSKSIIFFSCKRNMDV